MADERNYLIGYGERLTHPIAGPPGKMEKSHPYTFKEAKRRLLPRIRDTVSRMDALPDLACPNDEAVASITLHPAYLAKSYYPERLL